MVGTLDLLLPFYGDPDLLKQTVESVRHQSDEDWRLVVVDDGYPDGNISDWFDKLEDDRILYHRNSRNLGANANYRRALSMAVADYVVFLGADDLLRPNYITCARAVLDTVSPDVAVYHPGVEVINEQGVPTLSNTDRMKQFLQPRVSQPTRLAGESLAASLLRGNWTYFPAICWRRAAIESIGFRNGLHVVQDLALLLDLVANGHSLVLDPRPTFAYRRHSASDSSVKAITGERFAEEHAFFETAASDMQRLGWRRAARAAKLHSTSRLNALTLVPTAIAGRDRKATTLLLRHVIGMPAGRDVKYSI